MFITQTTNTMKTLKAKLSVIVLLTIGAGSAVAQEYDDMYFSAKDRKQVKYVSDDKAVTQDLNQVSQVSQNPAESFSSKTVNPEYIAKYQAASQQEATAEFADDEYFVEDYNDNNLNQVTNDFQNSSQVAVRDRYGNISYFRDYSDVYWSDPFLYEGTVFDPFYRPYYSRFGYGNRWNRPWRSGWSVSVGWGWNSWGYNPWNTGWSFNTGWGWNSPWGFNYGYGYNSWNNGWCPPGYGWGNNVVVINNYENRSNRVYRSGRASSRSGIVNSNNRRRSIASGNSRVDNDRSSTNGRSAVSSTSRSRYISESNSRRDYDDAQSKYYRRSRSSVSSSSGDDNRSYTSRSRSTSNYTPNSRSYSNSRSSTLNRSSRSSSNNRSYNNRSYNSRSSGSFSRPSNSRSNGYTPNRSSGNNRSSSFNRSSGNSSRSSGVSRSSSSSRSSGSRSSGSSRSSNRRGGN